MGIATRPGVLPFCNKAAQRKHTLRFGDVRQNRTDFRKEGTRFPAEISGKKLSDGATPAIAPDITERRAVLAPLEPKIYNPGSCVRIYRILTAGEVAL